MAPVAACHGLGAASAFLTALVMLYGWRFLRRIPVVKHAVPPWFGSRFDSSAPHEPAVLPFLVAAHAASSAAALAAWSLIEPCIGSRGTAGACGSCTQHGWKHDSVLAATILADLAFAASALAALVGWQIAHPAVRAAMGGLRVAAAETAKYACVVVVARAVVEGSKMLFDYESALVNALPQALRDKLGACPRTAPASEEGACPQSAASLKKRVDVVPNTVVKLALRQAAIDTIVIAASAGLVAAMWFAVKRAADARGRKKM